MTVRFLLAVLIMVLPAAGQDAEELFATRCALCHADGNVVNAPLPEALRQMSWTTILDALESGKMAAMGAGMTAVEREVVAKFAGTVDAQPFPASAQCSGTASAAAATLPSWNGWADAANTRFQSAEQAGLSPADVPKLRPKWAFGFPGAATAFGAPTVFGGRLFVGSNDGTVYSLDAETGCIRWSYRASAGVRVSPVIGNGTAYFGDLRGNVYALNAADGALLWKTRADDHPLGVITGSLKLHDGRLYVPVSGRDESIAAIDPSYECCTFRGSVAALDAATGERVWQAYTVQDEPVETGTNAAGTKTWGPSGAVPWSAPTLDLERRRIYIGTGVNYSDPPTDTSDAIVAIDMDSGALLWSRQFTGDDAYNFACGAPDKTNCPRDPFIDYDLGNSGILRTLDGGRRVLVASDKGGMVYAIDPDNQGEILWRRKAAAGGVNGGFMWGGASDEQGIAYLGISDFTAGRPEIGGGVVALDLATGEERWRTPAPRPTCLGTPGCSAAQPAPVTAIPGVVLLGSWDGHVRGYAAATGEIVWDFDTLRDFETVNGVAAHGGSINSVGPVVAGGMLYIGSGYASGTAMAGNVLLAFSVDGE